MPKQSKPPLPKRVTLWLHPQDMLALEVIRGRLEDIDPTLRLPNKSSLIRHAIWLCGQMLLDRSLPEVRS